jgi:hypothetical protein
MIKFQIITLWKISRWNPLTNIPPFLPVFKRANDGIGDVAKLFKKLDGRKKKKGNVGSETT